MKKIRIKTMEEMDDMIRNREYSGSYGIKWCSIKYHTSSGMITSQSYPIDILGKIFDVIGEGNDSYKINYESKAIKTILYIENEHCDRYTEYLVSIPEDLFDI